MLSIRALNPAASKLRAFLFSEDQEEAWLSRLPDFTLIYLLFSISYFFWYLTDPNVPANDPHNYQGWWSWWDQGQYWKTAGELANLQIGNAEFWWGYPLIGALFFHALPGHPFFFPNYILGFLVVFFFYLMAIRVITRLEAVALLILLILGSKRMMMGSLITPWNTIVTYATIYAISYLLVFSNPTKKSAIFCSSLVGLIALVRPQDWPLAFLYLQIVLFARVGGKSYIQWGKASFFTSALGGGLLIILDLIAFGHIIPPYIDVQREIGFSLQDLWFRFYQIFLDGTLVHGNSSLPPGTKTPNIFAEVPLAIFSVPGSFILRKKIGNQTVILFFICTLHLIFYLSFNACGNPPFFWTFRLYHYIWWAMTLLALIGYLYIRSIILKADITTHANTIAIFLAILILFIGFKESGTTIYYTKRQNNHLDLSNVDQISKNRMHFIIHSDGERGLRLFFRTTIPNQLIYKELGKKTLLQIQGRRFAYWKDYLVSQEGNTVIFHLQHPLPRQQTVSVVIGIPGMKNTDLSAIQLIQVKFFPFALYYRFLHRLTGTLAPSHSLYLSPPYLVGDTLEICPEKHPEKYLQNGWSSIEPDHVWSIQKTAQLRLWLEADRLTGNQCGVDLDFTTFGPNTLTVTLNGKRVGREIKTTGQRQRIRFAPCPEPLDNEVTIGLTVGTLRSPAQTGLSRDQRRLGLSLFSFRIGPKI